MTAAAPAPSSPSVLERLAALENRIGDLETLSAQKWASIGQRLAVLERELGIPLPEPDPPMLVKA